MSPGPGPGSNCGMVHTTSSTPAHRRLHSAHAVAVQPTQLIVAIVLLVAIVLFVAIVFLVAIVLIVLIVIIVPIQ